MNRDTRFALALPTLVGSVLLTCMAFTQIPHYQPPPVPWIAVAALSTTFVLLAAVKGCVDWVHEGRP